MIRFRPFAAVVAATLFFSPSSFADDDLWESKGPHVRIKRNDKDGTRVEFRRSPDDQKLVKTTKDENGVIRMSSVYFRNKKGFLTAGRIYDGVGNMMFRVRYGYDRETGQLIAEDMFDQRAPLHRFSENGERKEIPVRRIYYFYDAQGNQSKAISLVAKKGKTAEEVFGKRKSKADDLYEEEDFDPRNSTRPDDNPFDKPGR